MFKKSRTSLGVLPNYNRNVPINSWSDLKPLWRKANLINFGVNIYYLLSLREPSYIDKLSYN